MGNYIVLQLVSFNLQETITFYQFFQCLVHFCLEPTDRNFCLSPHHTDVPGFGIQAQAIQLLPTWQQYIPSWSAPLGQVRAKSYFGVNSVLYHSSLFSLSYFYFSGFLATFSAALSHRLSLSLSRFIIYYRCYCGIRIPQIVKLLLRAGDLRRRKSGKEAREVKAEKVKIGKNGKGRY